MLNIKIITIGKVKNKNIQELCQRYQKMISFYGKVKFIELKSESFGEDLTSQAKAKKIEGDRILNSLDGHDHQNIFLLSEHGSEVNTQEFTKLFSKQKEIICIIAGSLGFSEEVLGKLKQRIALSKLTFPHELARLILLEQIYRAGTIINNKSYNY